MLGLGVTRQLFDLFCPVTSSSLPQLSHFSSLYLPQPPCLWLLLPQGKASRAGKVSFVDDPNLLSIVLATFCSLSTNTLGGRDCGSIFRWKNWGSKMTVITIGHSVSEGLILAWKLDLSESNCELILRPGDVFSTQMPEERVLLSSWPLCYCLVHVNLTWTTRREPQLMTCLHRIGPWSYLWGIFWIAN